MTKNTQKQYLTYKGKPLIRKNDTIYYGNIKELYFVLLILQNPAKVNGLDVATKVIVQLMKNDDGFEGKNKIIKRAQREGIYDALDVGAFWLEDALKW